MTALETINKTFPTVSRKGVDEFWLQLTASTSDDRGDSWFYLNIMKDKTSAVVMGVLDIKAKTPGMLKEKVSVEEAREMYADLFNHGYRPVVNPQDKGMSLPKLIGILARIEESKNV